METPEAPKVSGKRPWWMYALGCGALVLCAGAASPFLILIALTVLGESLDAMFSQLSVAVDSAAGTPPPATPPQ